MDSVVRFINNQPPVVGTEVNGGGLDYCHGWEGNKKMNRTSTVTTPPELVMLGVPTRPFWDIFGYGMDIKRHHSSSTTTCMTMAYGGASRIGGCVKAAAFRANFGLLVGPNRAYKGPSEAPLPGTHVINNFF
ncbi:unnamed protein product [Urochloa humidicola]